MAETRCHYSHWLRNLPTMGVNDSSKQLNVLTIGPMHPDFSVLSYLSNCHQIYWLSTNMDVVQIKRQIMGSILKSCKDEGVTWWRLLFTRNQEFLSLQAPLTSASSQITTPKLKHDSKVYEPVLMSRISEEIKVNLDTRKYPCAYLGGSQEQWC